MTFGIGDRVTWESQSAGYSKKKSGVVVAVVPPRQFVNYCIPCGFLLKSIPGKPRPHESYLIRVGASASLYWPRVAMLNKEADAGAWIRCDEKLPPIGVNVLVVAPGSGVVTAVRKEGSYWRHDYAVAGRESFHLGVARPTHWMPLPAPPEKEE